MTEMWSHGIRELSSYNRGNTSRRNNLPMLCNVALNGMESTIKACGKIRKRIVPSIKVVRYADDVVITGKSRTILQQSQKE